MDLPRITAMSINLDLLVSNYAAVSAHVSPAAVTAVVKSEAYGHGAVPCALALQEAGCRRFAVALVDEGIQLRNAGIEGEILVMGAVLPEQLPCMARFDLVPVLPDADRMRCWDTVAASAGRALPYHVKVDVGLGRMGSLPNQGEEIAGVAAGLRHARLKGISSHLSAPESSPEHNEAERARFLGFCSAFAGRFTGLERHLAASQAAARFKHMHLELVRIGGLIYGLQHVPSEMQLNPVMTLTTKVAQVKELPPGWHVGYGLKHRVEKPTTMALLPMGWTDGFFGAHAGHADVLIEGQFRRLIGVCTDFAIVDVTGGPAVRTGDECVLIGAQGGRSITAIEFGRRAGVSTGQLLGKISLRVPRIYTRHGRPAGELSLLSVVGGGLIVAGSMDGSSSSGRVGENVDRSSRASP